VSAPATKPPCRIPDEWQRAHRAAARRTVRASYRHPRRERSNADRTRWRLTGTVLIPTSILLTLVLQSPAPLVALLTLSALVGLGVVGGRIFAAALLQAGTEPAQGEALTRAELHDR
jgi:hypothetical protein